ncbi:MAG: hypothetical protein JM58_06380 [Peptococcaceae bacterium BICA1-8]|nr:MAG: hypothetical protein JM58_06380 [Peptococcaceae bacterium BICA1-8]
MKLFEYQGKILFNNYGINTPKSVIVESLDNLEENLANISYPSMVKVQVLEGGRGKAGGIKGADSPLEAANLAKGMLGKAFKSSTVTALLVEEKVDLVEEYYLAITLDSESRMPVIIFSKSGGIDIEDIAMNNPEEIIKVLIDPLIGLKNFHLDNLAKKADIKDNEIKKQLAEIVRALYKLYVDYDAMLVEINPLMKLRDNTLIAADAKVEIDDSAVFRHADLLDWNIRMPLSQFERMAQQVNFLYIDINDNGNVGVISNGSGMLMSCIDWIARQGGQVSCALDLGGGATAERVAQGIKIINENPNVKTILISIFGGITRCNEIAEGIIKAYDEISPVPIVARLDGTNKEQGLELLLDANREGINIAYSLKDAADKVLKASE